MMTGVIEISASARKHGYADEEIEYAVLHAVGYDRTTGIDGNPTFMFVGHPRAGSLDDDFMEVGVTQWPDRTLHAFHAMRLSSKWMYLRYQ